jgi:8-oxo-dGTP diphosphatase
MPANGVPLKQIARELGLARGTVRRFARNTVEDVLPQPRTTSEPSALAPYYDHLHRRFAEGVTNAAVLHAEIRALGFRGARETVRRYLQPLRANDRTPKTDDWEIPGSGLDADESPFAAAVRELEEELGMSVVPGRLLVVDWVPPRPGRTDGVMFVSDGGVLDPARESRIKLPPEELRSWAWSTQTEADSLPSDLLARRVRAALRTLSAGVTLYLENGAPVAGAGSTAGCPDWKPASAGRGGARRGR